MKCDKKMMLLYAVTDRAWAGTQSLYEQVEAALKGGVTCVQLREKELEDEAFLAEAIEISALCRRYGVPFFINDNVDIAIKCHADGIHVGQDDMDVEEVRRKVGEELLIGVSVHTVEEALEAVRGGADCLGVGAIFSTDTKTDADVLAMEAVKDICEAVDVPVVAIGGICKENILQLATTGVDGVALVSAIFSSKNIENECRELYKLSEKMVDMQKTDGEKKQSKPEKNTSAASEKIMPTALTIAGSDSSGGAGIQADIKTMTINGVYAMSVITALTAQNTTGVRAIQEATPDFLEEQLDAVFEDIFPDAVKLGMVSSTALIEVIAKKLRYYKAKNIVIDPVMVATSGSSLMQSEAVQGLTGELFPLATLVTPNIPEAEVLSGMSITTRMDMENAARHIGNAYGCAVLLKGGHSVYDANDLLYADGELEWFYGKRISNPNTHGTGCTLSSAIAANFAKGYSMRESVRLAKEYLTGALAAGLKLGAGSGPIMHNYKYV